MRHRGSVIIMNRFFVDAAYIGKDHIVIDSPQEIKHITKVLRLSEGDHLDISDGVQWEYRVKIDSIEQTQIRAVILDKQSFAREPDIQVTLFQGIPKQSKMEMIVQKCVELGVHDIVPVFTARTVVTDNGKLPRKVERWQKVSAEAVKQCKRGIIPVVASPISFADLMGRIKGYDLILFPYENEEEKTIKDCLRNLNRSVKRVGIIIGPEGGFADEEAEELKAAGAVCVTLGKTILRTETAGLAALAVTMYELEL